MSTTDKLARLAPADGERLGLCVHEAAHAIVGVLNGGTIERARLTEGGTDGECDFTAESFAHDRTRYRRALVAAAGPAAAAIFSHGPQPSGRQLDAHLGSGDREVLRLAAFHSYLTSDEQLWAALPVVRQCWRPIGILAAKMMRGQEINHDDVLAALGVTDGGGPGSAQLAAIRNGGVPRTTIGRRPS